MKISDITEEKIDQGLDNAVEEFKKKFPDTILYHGNRNNFITGHFQKLTKFREKSKDTPNFINYLINQHLIEDFGVPVRNLMYLTENPNIAEGYGYVYIVIPKGNYRMFYASGVDDFTVYIGYQDIMERIVRNVFDIYEYSDKEQYIIKKAIEINHSEYFRSFEKASNEKEMNDAIKYIEYISEEKDLVYRFHENILEESHNYVENLYNDFYNVEEIKSSDDMPSDGEEIMAYFPNGFYLINEGDIEDYFE